MSKPNKRRVRMDQFKSQIADAVLADDRLVEIAVSDSESVWIKIPLMLADDDDFPQRLREAEDGAALALVILSGHPDVSAEEQWATWTAAGYDEIDLATLFGTENQAAQERLKNFRYAAGR